ncbi:phospholipase A1-like [Condylostylus longicornis]|uniref:phospholipase A1-like n=1 Tax=Condylostylus longicornis TaxID=2530218 RepID=UPI00244DFFD0|nr:phospholipase A1-like [Condylostylus longicornis]
MSHRQAEKEFLNLIVPQGILNVVFFLFTSKNQEIGEIIQINNTYNLKVSNFNPNYPTRIIIHGWRNRHNSAVNRFIREAYLKVGKYNIIVVDWSSAADTYNYISARYSVEYVGNYVAEFIDFLQRENHLFLYTLIVIGHSLGAHVAGYAGQTIKTGKIPIIYGLDPAYPLFSLDNIDERLSDDDAEYVETIQTNAGILGFKIPIGITTFYPNWGLYQDGCGYDWNGQCSHQRAYKYFAESILKNNFIAIGCETYDEFLKKNCSKPTKLTKMASLENYSKTKGIFYLGTNEHFPYGRGNN